MFYSNGIFYICEWSFSHIEAGMYSDMPQQNIITFITNNTAQCDIIAILTNGNKQ